jgi:cysteinyl-tRNA synthetase
MSSKNNINYRYQMRRFILNIASQARKYQKDFIIITQNGLELFREKNTKNWHKTLINTVNGIAAEEVFYGNPNTGAKTPPKISRAMLKILLGLNKFNKKILLVDYVKKPKLRLKIQGLARRYGFISFTGQKDLARIPQPKYIKAHKPQKAVPNLQAANNFLYLINPKWFSSRNEFVKALAQTKYDLLIIDAFFKGKPLTPAQIMRLKQKKSGSQRLVIAYLSIGEAENYRYYWKKSWYKKKPPFLAQENPQWAGNYKVKYWLPSWQKIICGLPQEGDGFEKSYLKRIIAAGFDGVYLDIIDAALYFEKK